MASGRDTPKDLQAGEFGYEPGEIDNFSSGDVDHDAKLGESEAVRIGKEIWQSSTNWINSGRRSKWNDSLRAFQSLHGSGSKYLSGDYRMRSRLYRPKTRAMVRRDEAGTAASFFSNEDVVSIDPEDDDDPKQLASAAILKALLQYRLTKTIPWFLTVVGARQDCEVMGIAVAKCGWDYQERFVRTERRPKMGEDGHPVWNDKKGEVGTEQVDIFEVTKDQPFCDLLAPENFRFEPGCDWRSPVTSSPFLVELAPVYIGEALEKMESHHGAPAEWRRIQESALTGATDLEDDVTRRTRESGRVPGKDNDGSSKANGFDICWTRVNIVRWRGEDYYFRTLANGGQILEPPKPLREVLLHGQRPYVVGCVIVETHKTYPSGKVELTSDLQQAANEDWNSRFDSIKLGLQPRQFVKTGAGQDLDDLRRFVPGKVVSINAQKGEPLTNVITWDRPPPVDSASFQEQDRINLDWDDLTGAFTNSSVRSSEVSEQSATGMHLMSGEASGLTEYENRVFAETFVEPVLKLLIKLEQAYETDPVILGIAGKKAQLFQKFNISEIDDELLNHEVTTKVNVGIGATNPNLKLKNFATGAQVIGSIFGKDAAMGANFQEVSKEVFGLLGYKDGDRFFKPTFDPRVQQLQDQLNKLQGKDGGDGGQDGASKIQVANIQAQSKQQSDEMKQKTEMQMAQLDFATQKMEEDAETQRETMRMQGDMLKAHQDRQHEAQMGAVQQQHDVGLAGMQQQHAGQLEGMKQQAAIGMQGQQQEHDAGLQQAQQGHDQEMQGAQLDNSQQLAAMKPVPGGAPAAPAPGGGSGALVPQQPQQNGGIDAQTLHEVGGHMQAGMMAMMQGFVAGMQGIVQHLESNNENTINAMSALMQQSEQSGQQTAQAMQAIAQMVASASQQSGQGNKELIATLTRKRKILRGMDGKVEGLE